jgi:hypothetical protein
VPPRLWSIRQQGFGTAAAGIRKFPATRPGADVISKRPEIIKNLKNLKNHFSTVIEQVVVSTEKKLWMVTISIDTTDVEQILRLRYSSFEDTFRSLVAQYLRRQNNSTKFNH